MKLEHVNLILAVAVAGAALWQYRKAQRWKRAEFVAAEIKDAFSDPSVRNALYLLDWNARVYDLREREEQSELSNVEIRDPDLAKALEPHSNRPDGFTLAEERIRVVFDELFGRLQRFEYFIQTGLVKKRDVFPYLRYWLNLLGEPATKRKPEYVLKAIWLYIEFYGYTDLQKFMGRFGYDIKNFGSSQQSRGDS